MEDIPYLLPSEIARLVYGQLKNLNCDEVAEKFLHTSPHMKECLELKQKNRSFTTKAYNLSLEEIFDQFLHMNELLLNFVNNEIRTDEKLHDPVAALKFLSKLNESIILERKSPDGSKCDASGDDNTSDIDLHIGPSPEKTCSPLTYPKKLDLLYNNELSNRTLNSGTNNPTRSRGKVKVLKPKLKTLSVAGKSINRCNDAFESSSKDITSSVEYENQQMNNDNHHQRSPFSTNDSDSYTQSQPQISTFVPASEDNCIVQCNSSVDDCSFQLSFDDENRERTVQLITSENIKSSTAKSINSNDKTSVENVNKNMKNRKTKKTILNDEIVWNGSESVENIEVIKEKYIQKNIIENVKFAEVLANNINKTLHETPSEQIDRACAELAAKMADEKVQTDLHGLLDELLSGNPSENKLEDPLAPENIQVHANQTVTKQTNDTQLTETSHQDLSQMNLRNYVMNNTDIIESTEDEIVLCNSSTNNTIQIYSVDARDAYFSNAIVIGNNLNTVTDKPKKSVSVKCHPSNRIPRILPRLAPKPNAVEITNNMTNDAMPEKVTKGVRSSKRIKKS